ncbi:DUF6572 domain-containing protein [Parasediminibacterium paludis]|uniref:DUF6572 domain-containing protein n=1 Tax=Parasediminibacterium paludis TaxID=908966 RepID=A0ABV8PXS1_9BACT
MKIYTKAKEMTFEKSKENTSFLIKIFKKMPVDDLSVIDFVAINVTTGEAMLVIADHLEWDEQNEHLLILQNKINAYLEGIENGSLYEEYPDAKNRNIVIDIKAKFEPNEKGSIFLERTKKDLNAAGYQLDFTVLKF